MIQRSNPAFLSRANPKLPVGVGEAIREGTRNLSGLPLTFLGILNNVIELHRSCFQILPMKLQVSILVLIRLLAVHWSLQLVTVFGPQMLGLFRMPEQTAETYLYYAVLAAPLIALAALWFLAMPIARLVTRGISEDLSIGSVALADWYSLAFIGMGLYYLISSFAVVLGWAFYFLKSAATHHTASERALADALINSPNSYGAWQAVVTFLLGGFLLLHGRKFAVAFVRKHQKPMDEAGE